MISRQDRCHHRSQLRDRLSNRPGLLPAAVRWSSALAATGSAVEQAKARILAQTVPAAANSVSGRRSFQAKRDPPPGQMRSRSFMQRREAQVWMFLVNNAGLFMNKLTLTEDGVETTIAVNHLAPFLLTQSAAAAACRPSGQPGDHHQLRVALPHLDQPCPAA